MMKRKVFVIVTAGGSGVRMGAALPKQFLSLDGRLILERTVYRFSEALPGAEIITVLPRDQVSWWRNYCKGHDVNVPQTIVEGGFTRYHSVKNALSHVPDGAIVAVHDGVRPFVTVPLIRSMAAIAEDSPAVIPVLPVTDTLKVLERTPEGLRETDETADRSRIFSVQTPQFFHSEALKAAYDAVPYEASLTDDSSVARRNGVPLTFTEGERYNIKITTPEDMDLGVLILRNFSS